ncbi:hypothetical protein ACFW04_010752 [Cataglyphis niger]
MNSCCAEKIKTRDTSEVRLIPAVSRPAPSWSGVAIIDLKMQEISSKDFPGKYVILLFYPSDFSNLMFCYFIVIPIFYIDSEIIAISTDSKFSHFAWVTTPRKQGGLGEMKIPLLSDRSHQIAKDYGVLNEKHGVACRALFVIDAQRILLLRVIKACRFVDEHGSACALGPLEMKTFEEESNYFHTD